MEYDQILERAFALIGGGSPALLSTIGEGGYPHTRWMTPAALPRLKGMVYAVTSRGFPKATEIETDPRVQWIFQAPDFSEVTTLTGRARLISDPSFSAEVLKAIGPHLATFWRLNNDPSSLRVIETEVLSASILFPLRAERYSARSAGEEAGRG